MATQDVTLWGINCGYGRNIWNNGERGPAVLYDAQGHEVSRK